MGIDLPRVDFDPVDRQLAGIPTINKILHGKNMVEYLPKMSVPGWDDVKKHLDSLRNWLNSIGFGTFGFIADALEALLEAMMNAMKDIVKRGVEISFKIIWNEILRPALGSLMNALRDQFNEQVIDRLESTRARGVNATREVVRKTGTFINDSVIASLEEVFNYFYKFALQMEDVGNKLNKLLDELVYKGYRVVEKVPVVGKYVAGYVGPTPPTVIEAPVEEADI